MKTCIYYAVLFFISTAFALESYIPVLKDGWVSGEANQGKSRYLRVAEGTRSWLTFATGNYNLSTAVSAHLAVFIDEIKTSEGTLVVSNLENAPAFLESATGWDDIKVKEEIIKKEIVSENFESIILIDITSAVKADSFKGIVLGSEGLELMLSSKEGAFKPFILLKQEVQQFTISDNSLTESKIADNAVTAGKLANGAVTSDKLGEAAVNNDKLANGAVTNSKLTDKAVTEGKLNDSAVTNTKLARSSVTTEKLSDSAVTEGKLARGAVTEAKIAEGAVTNEKIASLDYGKLINKPAFAGDGHTHTVPEIDNLTDSLKSKHTEINENVESISNNTDNISQNKTDISNLTETVGTNTSSVADHNVRITSLEKNTSYPPSGDAGGALSGSYPNPELAGNSVTSSTIQDGQVTGDDIQDHTITSDHISASTWNAKAAANHDHASQNLAPETIQVGGSNAPKIATLFWEGQTTNGASTILELNDRNYASCPNPSGIISLAGIIKNSTELVPDGLKYNLNDQWEIKYKDLPDPDNDELEISTPYSNTQNKPFKIICTYIPAQ